ncbi:hypothetical protein [Actinomadura litoris]|uniref:hypothetical protein n=1 Tax=Actinomadura litoris TaxID=2678616 RepID=UPI001FA7FDB3|nr:hypothetical protein [Actinomadura litoris]
MIEIPEMLARHAAEYRTLAADAGRAATEARPRVVETLAALDEIQAEREELERRLGKARAEEATAAAEHEAAQRELARLEKRGQDAADIAESLAKLAAMHSAPDALPEMRPPAPPVVRAPEPDADLTAPGVIDSREQIAALTGGNPLVTADDPPEAEPHRHAKPKRQRRRRTGPQPLVAAAAPTVDEDAVPDNVLAEGARRATPTEQDGASDA